MRPKRRKKNATKTVAFTKFEVAVDLSYCALNDMDQAMSFVESNIAGLKGKQCVVAAHTYIRTWMVASATLAHDNVASDNALTTKLFNA
jgi:hypothetical protein